jgi:hypothetical protein
VHAMSHVRFRICLKSPKQTSFGKLKIAHSIVMPSVEEAADMEVSLAECRHYLSLSVRPWNFWSWIV